VSRLAEWLENNTHEWANARELAEAAVDAGIFDDDREQAVLNWATVEVRRQLKRRRDGLPRFGNLIVQTPDGRASHRYKALSLFSDDDFRQVIAVHMKRADGELAIAAAYESERRQHYGGQLQIPQLSYTTEAA